MTWNDLECPIQLKVRMSHGLLTDSVDTSLAKFTISERAEKDVYRYSLRAVSLR